MKKHSKTGVESRFQGTVLGVPAEPKTIKIEGGVADSIEEWCRKTRERAAKAAESKQENRNLPNHVETREASEDVVMEME
jgi:transcription initiation factor TFIID subunit 3